MTLSSNANNPGVDFINILGKAFTDAESAKKTDSLIVFFGAVGIFMRKSCT
jgi:hypothetical protein